MRTIMLALVFVAPLLTLGPLRSGVGRVVHAQIAFEGCGPGYWAGSQHLDSWPAPYGPFDRVRDALDVSVDLNTGQLDLNGDGQDDTFRDALRYRGGSGTSGAVRLLLRSAVAALLNAAHPDVDYPRTVAQVIAEVNAALAGRDPDAIRSLAESLRADSSLGCPLT